MTMNLRAWARVSIGVLLFAACDSEQADSQANGADDDAGTQPAGGSERALCSGCNEDVRAPSDLTVRVHHVHLNVHDASEAREYYEKFFGAEAVRLNEAATVLWADPLLLLLDEVDHPLSETLEMGFEHIGLGVEDVVAWFEHATTQGIVVDTRGGAPETPISIPTIPGSSPFSDPDVDDFTYIYLRGPNAERVEVWSGLLRFRHLHFLTPDIDGTVAWYQKLLGVAPLLASSSQAFVPTNGFSVDGVQLNFLTPPSEISAWVPTDDRPVGHFALSVPSLDEAFVRLQAAGIPVVSAPAPTTFGFRSFFVRGPQEVLIELVEAGPIAFR